MQFELNASSQYLTPSQLKLRPAHRWHSWVFYLPCCMEYDEEEMTKLTFLVQRDVHRLLLFFHKNPPKLWGLVFVLEICVHKYETFTDIPAVSILAGALMPFEVSVWYKMGIIKKILLSWHPPTPVFKSHFQMRLVYNTPESGWMTSSAC